MYKYIDTNKFLIRHSNIIFDVPLTIHTHCALVQLTGNRKDVIYLWINVGVYN